MDAAAGGSGPRSRVRIGGGRGLGPTQGSIPQSSGRLVRASYLLPGPAIDGRTDCAAPPRHLCLHCPPVALNRHEGIRLMKLSSPILSTAGAALLLLAITAACSSGGGSSGSGAQAP